MSINVYVIDDELIDIEKMLQFLKTYHDLAIHTFTSYEQLAEHGAELSKADVAFIDIQFGTHTGFEVVQLLNKYNSKCIFTFFTNYSEYLKQGYEYRIYRYILKEEPDELISKQIKETIDEYYKLNKFVRISDNNQATVISLENVVYIETLNHTSTFHMINGEKHNWNKPLNYILSRFLDNRFVQCHKAYITNLSQIKSLMGKKRIIMNTGEQLDIGRVYKSDFLLKYNMYLKSL